MGMVVGDARSLPVAAGSVQCVVTSPPYWGLRDYGTARWEGGGAGCDHVEMAVGMSNKNTLGPDGYLPPTNAANVGRTRQYRSSCSKCGARRIDRQLGLESTPDCGLTGKLRLRDDIDGDDLSLAIRGVLFGVWGNDGGWAGERDVRELLSQAIQGREEAEDAGTSASLLPKESCGVQPADQGKESGAAGADDSGLGRSMCVLRGDGADLSLPRPHQGGRAQGIRGEGRDGLEAGRQRGATKGSLSAALLELQRGARTIRTLPALIVDRASVPTECLQWFRSAECGECYVCHLVSVMREVRRVLRDDGTLWLNLGDSYAAQRGATPMPAETLAGGVSGRGDTVAKRGRESAHIPHRDAASIGLKHKDLCGIPWRVAFALQADGWYLRQDIIWAKPNPMPESVRDRCTKAHEYLFLLTKRQKYYYDAEAIAEPSSEVGTVNSFGNKDAAARCVGELTGNMKPGVKYETKPTRNRRSVWTVNTQPYAEAHFATFPEKLVEPCVLAGTSARGCCPLCRTPWVRVVESRRVMRHELPPEHPDYRPSRYTVKASGDDSYANGGAQAFRQSETIGWRPDCFCMNDPANDAESLDAVPCLVLDPFAGSGTVGAVCRKLARRFVGVELNPKYVDLARARMARVQPGLALEVA
jgi:hypothetical protein